MTTKSQSTCNEPKPSKRVCAECKAEWEGYYLFPDGKCFLCTDMDTEPPEETYEQHFFRARFPQEF